VIISLQTPSQINLKADLELRAVNKNNPLCIELFGMKTTDSTSDIVRTYLKEIGQIDMLSREEEIELGKQVQALIRLQALRINLQASLNRDPTLDEWAGASKLSSEELKSRVDLGLQAKKRMVTANLRLVVAIAKKYVHRNVDFIDLIQEGSIGLVRGVEKFDPAKGYRFSTYTYWWIRQAITRAIAEKGRTIRLPIHVTEKLSKIKSAQWRLVQKLGRAADAHEIAAELKMPEEDIRKFLRYSEKTVSLEMRVGEDDNSELGDVLKDEAPTPEDFLAQSSLKEDLFRSLQSLPSQQQEVIRLRFGLGGNKELTLSQIGARLNISRERVRQIERDALKKMRNQNALRDYLAS